MKVLNFKNYAYLILLTTLTSHIYSMQHNEYLNYEQIKQASQSETENKTITVRCFDNGLWKVCPNPKDEKRAKDIQKAYEIGHYISYEDIKISQKTFDNQQNWNS